MDMGWVARSRLFVAGRNAAWQRIWAPSAGRGGSRGQVRGCARVLLDTFSFQAPDFYRHLGYQEIITIENFPGL